MNSHLQPYSVLIPAAGNSGRMGMPKLLLPFEDHTFCEEIYKRYSDAGAEKIVFVINQQLAAEIERMQLHQLKSLQFIVNDNPSFGRFRSVQIGLSGIPDNIPCFLQNSDNPFVHEHVLLQLLNNSQPDCTVIPFFEKQPGHPVLIGADILKNLLHCSANDANLRTEIKKYLTKPVDVSTADILLNINTPEDYQRVFGKPVFKK